MDVQEEKEEKEKEHFCYIIYDIFGSTYNGYTCNMNRRIRQHNNVIKGGAKFTTKRQYKSNASDHWKYMLSITSDHPLFDYKKALSMEWSIKNPTNRRTKPNRSIYGRIKSLPLVFSNPKFCDLQYNLFVHQSCFWDDVKANLISFPNVNIIAKFDDSEYF